MRRYYGNAAHFIGGRSCRFHIATEVPGYLVSTVGEYYPMYRDDGKHNKPTDIGYGRTFETMVFGIGDERCHCGCGVPVPKDWSEAEMQGYMTAKDATEGHEAMVAKYEALVPA